MPDNSRGGVMRNLERQGFEINLGPHDQPGNPGCATWKPWKPWVRNLESVFDLKYELFEFEYVKGPAMVPERGSMIWRPLRPPP